MQFDWWTFSLQTVNVVILIWLLQRFLLKPVLALIASRRQEVERAFSEADARTADARAAEQKFEKEQRDLAKRSEAVLEESHARAREAYRETVEKGRREAETFLEAERRRIEDERRDALADLRDKAFDLSVEVAGRLLAELDPATVNQVFLAAIEERLGGLPEDERAELRREAAGGMAPRLVTALPLSKTEQAHWTTRINEVLDVGAEVKFEVDESLIAGAELHFRNAVIRFNWRDKLADLRKSLAATEETNAETPPGT